MKTKTKKTRVKKLTHTQTIELQAAIREEAYRLCEAFQVMNRTANTHPNAIDYATACVLQDIAGQVEHLIGKTGFTYV